ncbi:ADC synthase [Rhizophagus irregularis]|nr:ADC synthase [Rhizophagus irregularis]CAB5193877.1 unnamed protein product [Rhizophagus irregularis]CAB5359253.1 unnamed protein product [Rhizophagus irregularis]
MYDVKPSGLNQACSFNGGKMGYESFVTHLKKHIKNGDIIQTVPSQGLTRPTNLHPFNIYRHLSTVNPSPYMFYINIKDYQIVGVSPELLVKVENDMVNTHPIASIRRGKTEEGEKLAEGLLKDPKEKVEHIMLVDLGKNDINRVCQPKTVKVDSLMQINSVDTCIAFRTILFKDGAAYIQTGGGIIYDDLEDDDLKDGDGYQETVDKHQETIDKLKSNVTCVDDAKHYYYKLRHKL